MDDEGGGGDARAHDLPYVDGRSASPEELREEVERERDPAWQEVEDRRAALAETAREISGRLDVRPRVSGLLARWRPALMVAAAVVLLGAVLRRRRSSAGRR